MKLRPLVAIVAGTVLGLTVANVNQSPAQNEGTDTTSASSAAAQGPKLETLLKTALEGVDDIEVVVSRVTIPPNTTLPKHWHPGEDFAYILEGEVVLWQEGKDDVVGTAGDAMMVPLKQVHTATTREQGATILVFRVHEEGKPERTLVD